MKKIDNLFQKIAFPAILIAGILMIYFLYINRAVDAENNGYVRVTNCILSFVTDNRTPEDIDFCYDTVEKEMGVDLRRYNRLIR